MVLGDIGLSVLKFCASYKKSVNTSIKQSNHLFIAVSSELSDVYAMYLLTCTSLLDNLTILKSFFTKHLGVYHPPPQFLSILVFMETLWVHETI